MVSCEHQDVEKTNGFIRKGSCGEIRWAPPYGAGLLFPDLAEHRRIFYIQQITLLLTICHQLELTRGALEG